jgi:hypothetical protein
LAKSWTLIVGSKRMRRTEVQDGHCKQADD